MPLNFTEKTRFRDEIEALKSYVYTKTRISNPRSTMQAVEKKVRSGVSIPNRLSDSLEESIDLGSRIGQMPDDYLQLLIDYYLLKRKANDLAEERNIGPAALGGKISQARCKLKKVLSDLLPINIKKRKIDPRILTQAERDQIDLLERRKKISRFLRKRVIDVEDIGN